SDALSIELPALRTSIPAGLEETRRPRRRRDSNARGSSTPPNRLAGGCFRPLSHVSAPILRDRRDRLDPRPRPAAFALVGLELRASGVDRRVRRLLALPDGRGDRPEDVVPGQDPNRPVG